MQSKVIKLEEMISKFQNSQLEQQKQNDLHLKKMMQEKVKKSLQMSQQTKLQE